MAKKAEKTAETAAAAAAAAAAATTTLHSELRISYRQGTHSAIHCRAQYGKVGLEAGQTVLAVDVAASKTIVGSRIVSRSDWAFIIDRFQLDAFLSRIDVCVPFFHSLLMREVQSE